MGYWDEKRKYEKERIQGQSDKEKAKAGLSPVQIGNQTIWIQKRCSWCGKKVKNKEKDFICQGSHIFSKGKYLCKGCAKKCKKCGKYFCPKHINNHKCKK